MNSHGHKTVICICGLIISTCRCTAKDKAILRTYVCKHKREDDQKTGNTQPTLVGFGE